jgi:MoaA/NifB/PqqE/SkfB family radical SAM enzyme
MKNKKGFCVAPFRHSDFLVNGEVWQCCNGGWVEEQQRWVNAWITTGPSGNVLENKWQEIWNGDIAKKLRQSMHDGDMKYCDANECNFLYRWNTETIAEEVYDNGYFPIYDETTIHKLYNAKEINPTGGEKYNQIIKDKMVELPWGPETVIFSHDRSCNLKCPSCRTDYIQSKGKDLDKALSIQEVILRESMSDAHELYITGSGDGFGGEFWRNLLKSITMEKYPNIKNLHLHTNGVGWTKKIWNMLSNLHSIPRITTEISIDAATEDTYHQIRVGGIWKTLQENLHFIFTEIPNLEFIRLTFVVQNNNYMEMVDFIKMADYFQKLNGMKTSVSFQHINNWGTFSDADFLIKSVANEKHPEYKMFECEVYKVKSMRELYPNLQIFTNF